MASCLSFQRNEEFAGGGWGPFDLEVASQKRAHLRGKRQDPVSVPFTMNADFAFCQAQILELEFDDLTGTQAAKKHQSYDRKVPR